MNSYYGPISTIPSSWENELDVNSDLINGKRMLDAIINIYLLDPKYYYFRAVVCTLMGEYESALADYQLLMEFEMEYPRIDKERIANKIKEVNDLLDNKMP